MATSYHYHCRTCNKTETEGITYKSISVLQELYQCWPLVRYIGQSSSIRVYLTEMAGPTYLHEYIAFLSEHYAHGMYLKSEYDGNPTFDLQPMPSKFLGLHSDAMGTPAETILADDFLLAGGIGVERFEKEVRKMINSGWECQGGVAVIVNSGESLYYQSMIKRRVRPV